jgi:hypothetical protein
LDRVDLRGVDWIFALVDSTGNGRAFRVVLFCQLAAVLAERDGLSGDLTPTASNRRNLAIVGTGPMAAADSVFCRTLIFCGAILGDD